MIRLSAVVAVLGALSALVSRPAHAVELLAAEAERMDGRYTARVEMRVAATPERVRTLLTDYDHLDRLSDAVLESALLERFDAKHVRVRVRVRTCFFYIICFTKTQVHDGVEESEVIHSTIVPDVSDFKSGWARWRITPEGGAARVRFDTEMEPDFWIPPLVGPEIVKSTLIDEAITVMESIEGLPQETSAPPAGGATEGPPPAPGADEYR